MTRGDHLLVTLVATAGLAVILLGVLAPSSSQATIVGPEGTSTVSTLADGTYVVSGSVGEVVVTVRDAEVRIARSSCPDQICVRSGALRTGAPIVCAPNGVTVFSRAAQGGLDAISR